MNIYLASYFEEENHGPGRKIGVSPGKPDGIDYECEQVHRGLGPEDIYWEYHKRKKSDPDKASEYFNKEYEAKLQKFVDEVKKAAQERNTTVFKLIGFEDGDTLLSWEKAGNMSFRTTLAKYLRKLGYDVTEN
jgi:hypothetical protein